MTNPLSESKESGNDTSCPDKPDYHEDSSTGSHDSSQITVDSKDISVGGSLKTVLNKDHQQDETSGTKSSQDTSLMNNDFEPSNPKSDTTKNGYAEDDLEKQHVENNWETCDTNDTKIETEKPSSSPATKVDETVSIMSGKPLSSPDTKVDETVSITSGKRPSSPDTKVDETVSIMSGNPPSSPDTKVEETVSIMLEKPPSSPDTKADDTVSITSGKPPISPATKVDETVITSGKPPSSPATKVDETVSITSESSSEDEDDDISLDEKSQNCNNDIIVLDNDSKHEAPNGVSQNCDSPEIHEIESDNDDCIVTNDDDFNGEEEKPVLRRSSRAIKQKKYVNDDDEDEPEESDESDVEEVEISDPLCHKPVPIRTDNAIAVQEIAKNKAKQSNNNQYTMHSEKKIASDGKNTSDSRSLYQSILARGTTVTPISSKISAPAKSVPESAQNAILPSLTDDMFVVEAPSFIVPYVYEKPSMKPFREFVDKLGKQLAEEKAKLEKEQSEKEKLEKELRDKLRQEKKERGEEVSETEDEEKKAEAAADEEKKKKKAQKREKRKRKNDDDASWDGSSSTNSDDETLSDDDTIVIKDKDDDIQDITGLTADKLCNGKSDNYFDCSLGKFFVNIGLSLVQEYVQTDLLKRQKRMLTKEKRSGYDTKETQIAIASLMKNIEFSKENNAPYSFQQQKCEFCSFRTESKLILDNHLQTPHMRNNNYKCNFCEFEVRNPHDILFHMEQKHQVKGKLERALGCHQCNNCPFEDNGKGKLARHQVACAKKFRPETNLAPPVEWEPPAKIPKIVKAKNNVGAFQNAFTRHLGTSTIRSPVNKGGIMSISSVSSATSRSVPASLTPSRTQPPVFGLPIMRANSKPRGNTSTPISTNSSINNAKPKTNNSLSISITPLPRQAPPSTQSSSYSKSFVICEICDGYITDLEQLRNHMQWIHKVRIPPKMIYNRPPLNCQKCQFRFFTDQGLERHLLGSHGLVTSSMQEAANKGKDAGRCPVCGRVFQWKLLSHVAKDHNLTLKPAHLSYKCTVCTATFSMYKQFEDHVYSAHSVVAKRVMDKSKTTATTAKQSNNSAAKQMKISDEITITPQPLKTAASAKSK